VGNAQNSPALRAEIQATLPQIALELPEQHDFYFFLAVRAERIYIFTTLKWYHNIQTSFKIVSKRS
jgi:hypothetical protein